MPESAIPAYITSLIRHFDDLRDGTHGGSASRQDKEAHFEKAVQLLGPIARQVLTEMNTSLLLDTGQLTETGLRRTADGGLNASWALSWPEQRAAGVEPIVLQAYFGGGFHHPHLRGTTGLSDRPCGDSKSRHLACSWSQSNVTSRVPNLGNPIPARAPPSS